VTTQFDKRFSKMNAEEQWHIRQQLIRELALMIRKDYKTGREAVAEARKMVSRSMQARKAENS
jgi:hypothetical protein